jgi:hypothetical protein
MNGIEGSHAAKEWDRCLRRTELCESDVPYFPLRWAGLRRA